MRKYVRACEVYQRVKYSPSLRAPLKPQPVPAECWESVSTDFVFGFPALSLTGLARWFIWVAVTEPIKASACARFFIDTVFSFHGLPRELVSDRDPLFTADFGVS